MSPLRPWSAALVVSALALAATLMLLRAPAPAPRPVAAPAPPPLRLARPGGAEGFLAQESSIRDLRPLFLPTEFNARLPEPRREAGRPLLEEDLVNLPLGDGDLGVLRALPLVAALDGLPADRAGPRAALAGDGPGVAATGFGRREQAPPVPSPRGGLLEVVAVGSGERVFSAALPPALAPPPGKPWDPLELLAAVDAAGLAAPLAVTESSRVEEVDAHFRRVLRQNYRLGERLVPGIYRVVVGP